MRRLQLDFHRSPPPSLWSWLFLLSGLTTLIGLLSVHRQITDETSRHLAGIQQIEARHPGASQTVKPSGDASLSMARRTIIQNQQPWNDLFATLEAADNKDIAVLNLAPEPGKGQLKIQAEARNLGAMLAYHRRLEESPSLRNVALQEHDIAKESKEAPVRFHIIADWGGRRGGP